MRTVVDEESLVAGGHEVAGLLVGAVSDLCITVPSARLFSLRILPPSKNSAPAAFQPRSLSFASCDGVVSYLGHSSLALEPSSDAVVNTLGLPP
jgi:hypothetical protein